jgi:hypothetical protein
LSRNKYIFTYFGDNQSIASTVSHLTQKEKGKRKKKTKIERKEKDDLSRVLIQKSSSVELRLSSVGSALGANFLAKR